MRLVGHGHTCTTHTNIHSDVMKSSPCLSVFNKVRLSNSPLEGSKVKLSITVEIRPMGGRGQRLSSHCQGRLMVTVPQGQIKSAFA